jgi:hypothetical protein
MAQNWEDTLRSRVQRPSDNGDAKRMSTEAEVKAALGFCQLHLTRVALTADPGTRSRGRGPGPGRTLRGSPSCSGLQPSVLPARAGPCPAAGWLTPAAQRSATSWGREGECPVRRACQDSPGFRVHHLQTALSPCAMLAPPRLPLSSARVRLSVLQWELAELGRRQAWDRRGEPDGKLGEPWQGAMTQVGGLPNPSWWKHPNPS